MNLITIGKKIAGSRIIRGFLSTMIGSGFSKIILVFLTFYCTNTLSQTEFGEFSFVRNTLNMILCICALNFSSLCTKFTVEASSSRTSLRYLIILFAFSLSICLVIGSLLLFAKESILLFVLKSHNLIFYFRAIGLLLPLFILQPLIEGVLRGLMRFKIVGVLQIISSLFSLLSVIVGIERVGIQGAMISIIGYYLFYTFISIGVLYWLRKRLMPISLGEIQKEDFGVLKTMILPVFFMSFIEAPIFWLAQWMLIDYDRMDAVGSMTVIMQIRNLAILIPTYFFNTFLAFAGELHSNKDFRAYFRKFNQLLLVLVILGVILCLILSLWGCPILSLFGSSYSANYRDLFFSNLGIPLLMLSGLLRIDLIIQEHQKLLLYISILWNTIWIAAFYLLLELDVIPLRAFFVSQLLGISLQSVLYYIIYRRDQKHLMSVRIE